MSAGVNPYALAPLLGQRLGRLLLTPWIRASLQRRMRGLTGPAVAAIQAVLEADAPRARAIFHRSLTSFIHWSLDYTVMGRRGPGDIERRAKAIALEGMDRLTPFKRAQRPVLILTMHMGDFQLGFLKLMAAIQSERKVFVFKAGQNNPAEDALYAAYRRHAGSVDILRTGEEGGRRAYLELRRGNVVAMACDLEVNVTSRTPVRFFDRPCMMQTGPATLAVLTRAVIVPVINFTDPDGRPTIRVEEPLFPEALDGEKPADTIHRLTQSIASHMENWIRIDPAQVHTWSGLAETIHHPLPPSAPAPAPAPAAPARIPENAL